MPTVSQFIESTLRLIRVLDSGESATATELNDGLTSLNQLIGSWSAAGVPIYTESRDTIPTTGFPFYPMPGPRPIRLTSAQVINSGVSFPVAIVPSEVWTQPKDRSATSKFAKELYYDGAFPTGNVNVWPLVAAGGILEIYSLKPLGTFSSLNDILNLPPGYEQALRFALASVLAPEYGSALPPELAGNAQAAQAAISAMNASIVSQAPRQPAQPAAV